MDPLWLLGIGMGTVVGGIMLLRLHAFLALILAAVVVGVLTPRSALVEFAEGQKLEGEAAEQFVEQPLGKRVAREFGKTAGNIGILIALASVIGKCLLDSGGADRIVRGALRGVGEGRAPLAFAGSGFVLSVPVFFDTVFYLLSPLAKALRLRTGKNYGVYIMSIIAGGTMAHSLVPPTPGPLFVADRLGVNMGMMIIGGGLLGAFTVGVGYLYTLWLGRRLEIPLRDSAEAPLAELTAASQREDRELPPLWFSLLPIVLPVVLIAGDSILKIAWAGEGGWRGQVLAVMKTAGDPNIALALAAFAAVWLVAAHRRDNARPLSTTLQDALAGGGLIILITAAGGAFGGVLQQTGVGPRIEALTAGYQLGLLPLAWLVTALVRTAQGSATVAMITAVGILGNAVNEATLGFHPLYLALAIGCGSKPFPWMNDSGFWIISRMSGMTIGETVKTFSFLVTIMGLAGLPVLMLMARFFPLT